MPRRPTKEFMERCSHEVELLGSVRKPGAVCAASWRKMSPKAKAAWMAIAEVREERQARQAKRKRKRSRKGKGARR